jgi:serine/threonine protein kinase
MTAPTRIGKYEIRRQIGRGAMGVVYEAFDLVIERRVAIKTLRLDIFEPSQTADVRARFKREAQAVGRLAHPHIVTVHEYGDHDGTPYIVMEFLAGNELSQILNRGTRLPLSEIVRLMTQLLGALTYAHEHKVVHRDVKPGNIFILDDGSLKVVDFGLAHVEASNLTDTGALLGTPAYMSPEQFLALPVDERSDIFSAGVILYELLTGEKPFTGSVTSIMQKVLRQEPMEPSALNPTIATAWDTVVKRAMAKKPDARFQSARQFSETVKQVFEKSALHVSAEVTLPGRQTAADLAGETVRPGVYTQHASKAQRSVPPSSADPEIRHAGRSFRNKSLALGGIAVVTAVGAATFYMSQRPRDDQTKQEPASKVVKKDDGAAQRAAAERAAAEKAAVDAKASTEKAAQEAKLAQERTAQEKALEAKMLAEKARAEKIATEKAAKSAADKAAADAKAAAEKAAKEAKLAQERAAQEKALEAKMLAENARAERVAAERVAKAAEEEKKRTAALDVARLEKLRSVKTEAERQAAEKAAAERKPAQMTFCPGSYNAAWTNCVASHTYPSGDKYVGEFKDGKTSGQGTYTFANGNKYVGEFKDNKFNGQGTGTFANGNKYVGEYKDSRYDGQGTFTFANGNKYVGAWKDGKYNGQGIEYRADGSFLRAGIWENGVLVTETSKSKQGSRPATEERYTGLSRLSPCPGSYNSATWTNCAGEVTYANGEKYVGEWREGYQHGLGTRTLSDGTTVSGIWSWGILPGGK